MAHGLGASEIIGRPTHVRATITEAHLLHNQRVHIVLPVLAHRRPRMYHLIVAEPLNLSGIVQNLRLQPNCAALGDHVLAQLVAEVRHMDVTMPQTVRLLDDVRIAALEHDVVHGAIGAQLVASGARVGAVVRFAGAADDELAVAVRLVELLDAMIKVHGMIVLRP